MICFKYINTNPNTAPPIPVKDCAQAPIIDETNLFFSSRYKICIFGLKTGFILNPLLQSKTLDSSSLQAGLATVQTRTKNEHWFCLKGRS